VRIVKAVKAPHAPTVIVEARVLCDARLIRYSPLCGRATRKKSCLRSSHLALFFPSLHRTIKPFNPDSFHQPFRKESDPSTTQPSLVLFSSTPFLNLHKKLDPKKFENHKKNPDTYINLQKTKKPTKNPPSPT
jgi:hypothetical protein